MQFQGLAVILNAAQFCAQQEVVKRIGCVRFTGGLYSGMEQAAGTYYEGKVEKNMAENTLDELYADDFEDRIRTIGVLTSGGDAPGMNAAIRAVVRTALSRGLKVRGIRRGYHGLLKEEIIDMSARDVSDTIQRGGTILQTARCKSMRTEEGQQKAAAICKKYGIDGLVVIGGDGSFAGA